MGTFRPLAPPRTRFVRPLALRRLNLNTAPLRLAPSPPQKGDTVNTSARMCTSSLPCTIQLSPAASELIVASQLRDYVLHDRGTMKIKARFWMWTQD